MMVARASAAAVSGAKPTVACRLGGLGRGRATSACAVRPSGMVCSRTALLLVAALVLLGPSQPAAASSGPVLRWSDAATWATMLGTHAARAGAGVPVAPIDGDDVVVPHNVTLVVDVAETPVLNRLVVVGDVRLEPTATGAGVAPSVDLRVRQGSYGGVPCCRTGAVVCRMRVWCVARGCPPVPHVRVSRTYRHTASWCWAPCVSGTTSPTPCKGAPSSHSLAPGASTLRWAPRCPPPPPPTARIRSCTWSPVARRTHRRSQDGRRVRGPSRVAGP